MTICIYGGTGFVGRHLCQAFSERGIAAASISRNPDRAFLARFAPSVEGIALNDSALPGILRRAEVIFYLASSTRPASSPLDPTHELEEAVESAKLVNMVRELNPTCHLVFTSSGGQIYGRGQSVPITETTPPLPATAYAFGKLVMENLLSFHARTSGLGLTILRLANPVGRWQMGKGHGFVAAAISCLLQGRPLTIFGDGGNVRDYFDADELGEFLSRFLDPTFRRNGIYNIGSGHGLTELEVITTLERITGRHPTVSHAPARPFDLRYAVLDIERAREELGWKPKCDLADTARKMFSSLS